MGKTIVAKLSIKDELISNFLQLAKVIIAETRKEEGCVSYNLYQNSFSNEVEFLFYEEYKEKQALELHNNSEHLANFFKEVTPLLASEPIINAF